MSLEEERIHAWFSLARTILSETGWEAAAASEGMQGTLGTLSHRPRPLGGHLIKFDFPSILIEGAATLPPENLLVRPEVRGLLEPEWPQLTSVGDFKFRTLKVFSPGDAMVHQEVRLPILRTCELLFGDSTPARLMSNFFYNPNQVLAWQQLRRDFPEPGQCCMGWFQELGTWQEYMTIARRSGTQGEDAIYRMVVCFSAPKDLPRANWASPFYSSLISSATQVICEVLNRPGVKALRDLDANFYIILSLRNFNRGPPMLPADSQDSVSMSISGGDLGLCCWTDYRMEGTKFRFPEYLRCFLKKLSLTADIWDSLDGRRLVPYQCVMQRTEWDQIKDSVRPALTLQKTAYRRARGGTTAPSLQEDVMPRFVTSDDQPVSSMTETTKVVVRNTFLELEEEILSAGMRRIKSDCELRKLVLV